VSGLDVGDILTRDGDIWDPFTSLSWVNESTTFKNFHTPISAETGVLYYLLFDSIYYCYGEHTYTWDGEAWGFTGIQNWCRDNSSARSLMIQESGGIFQARISGALISGTCTAKFRFAMVKP
jgi:hypothetical protein